jgi:hypothetical protein
MNNQEPRTKNQERPALITIDLMGITGDEVINALRELDREAAARANCYPRMIAEGKLLEQAAARRRLAWATAREVCACVARGMVTECGSAVRVLPVGPLVEETEEGRRKTEDGDTDDTAKGAKGREGGAE